MFSSSDLARMMIVPVVVFGSVCAALGYVVPKLVVWLWEHVSIAWN